MVGQEFPRRVTGYNRSFSVFGAANVNNVTKMTFNCPAGPGELSFVSCAFSNTPALVWTEALIIVLVDGVVSLGNQAYRLVGSYDSAVPVSSPRGGYFLSGYHVYNWLSMIPYETSCVVDFYTSSNATARQCIASVYGLVGR
jgi:hypothetical protein